MSVRTNLISDIAFANKQFTISVVVVVAIITIDGEKSEHREENRSPAMHVGRNNKINIPTRGIRLATIRRYLTSRTYSYIQIYFALSFLFVVVPRLFIFRGAHKYHVKFGPYPIDADEKKKKNDGPDGAAFREN